MSKESRERNLETLAQFGAGVLVFLAGVAAIAAAMALTWWLFK